MEEPRVTVSLYIHFRDWVCGILWGFY